jgi:molecular chaperone GrpE
MGGQAPAQPAEEAPPEAALDENPSDAENPQLAALEQELQATKERLLRAAAELDNTRKRAEREREDTAKYAVTGFARDLVSVFENLMRAASAVPEERAKEHELLHSVVDGVRLTLDELARAMEKQGIQRVDPMGQPFDHNQHQAIATLEVPGAEPGTVVQVIQSGYVIHDRLLRPAMVAVAKAPASPPPEPAVDEQA